MKVALNLVNVNKTYPNGFVAVIDFNLEIYEKEFIVFVGPSGCGKTTTLRMIAGLEDITDGDIFIDGRRVNDLLSRDRDIGMVFQSYALYPHMDIYNNLAFGLQLRHVPESEIKARVRDAAKFLGLTNLLERFPRMLSGGQRQRVALGRAIVSHARVFLMDEPLSNLDAKLRGDMRKEIIRIHRQVGGTTIYVTHDQLEAMSMATRIVVMNKGVVQQVGTPDEVYRKPANRFVASFIGAPMMNLIQGTFSKGNFVNPAFSIALPAKDAAKLADYEGKQITLGVRPEHVAVAPNAVENMISVNVGVIENLGFESIIHTSIKDQKIVLKVPTNISRTAKKINLVFDPEALYYFDAETEKNILDPYTDK